MRSLTLNIFDLTSPEPGECALVLGASESRTDRAFKIGDRSTSRRTAFSGDCRVRHLGFRFSSGSFLVGLRRIGKVEMIQVIEGVVHRGRGAEQAL